MTTVLYLLATAAVVWVGMALTATGLGGLPFVVLAALFVGLKLAGIINWSWWWVMLPLWGGISGAFAKMWLVTRDPFWRFRR
jgi:hypothetical protein